MPSREFVRVAAIGDTHYSRTSHGALTQLFAEVSEQADILVVAGDLTDFGLAEEAEVLARDLTQSLRIPAVGVLGNHDYEAGQEKEVVRILGEAGLRLLDGDATEILGVGFAGVRGFCGGFGRGALGAWGEGVIKAFVHEAINEALKLESALAKLKAPQRVAIVHYAPIRETVEGEPLEIYPFLGSSRLEEPLSRFNVSAVIHGHAHKGALEGTTSRGIPVYNVSLPLLQKHAPQGKHYRLLELPVEGAVGRDEVGISERRQAGRRSDDRAPAMERRFA